MSAGPELALVERPLIEQLVALGWRHLAGDVHVAYLTERESFREVLLAGRLRAALRRINVDEDGVPWLDDARVEEAVRALARPEVAARGALEANRELTELLLGGVAVEGAAAHAGGRQRVARFIDFEHPERNDFLAVNQFRAGPPGALRASDYLIPDIVLFVNGLPLVVIECKRPDATDPIDAAINQLLRYSNQRPWVDEPEGYERLFWTNQLMVATCGDDARLGTLGAGAEHYIQWKDVAPATPAQVAAELGLQPGALLSMQQTLAAGALRPERLLDIVRNFTLFAQAGGRTIKLAARYQQYRAVQRALARLQTGRTRRADGESDRRGGIVWHTQGSGKSLTMVFLIRALRSVPALRRFKVIVVTDRADLERQMSATAKLTNEPLRVARTSAQLRAILSAQGPDLVLAMIQKYQQRRDEDDEPSATTPARLVAEEAEPYDLTRRRVRPAADDELFPVLNESEDILVLVDEAHRSQSNTLHANLMRALPNCARIAFTGTPILIGEAKRTHDIFGDFIDRYTIQQSEEDGVTVPILYEGRQVLASISDGRTLDEHFAEAFNDLSPEDLERLRRRYATGTAVREAPQLIAAKAADMLEHYVDVVLPDGFKAQVVAGSRAGAILYQQALTRARDDLLAELDAAAPPADAERAAFLDRARPWRADLCRLEFAAVVSGEHNDPSSWGAWTDPGRQAAHVERFKKDLRHDDPQRQDGLAMLCVKSMLLTGFDAPNEQALYLDRPLHGHELLQAIARVNRTAPGKHHGLVVDYYGLGDELVEALRVYRDEDVQGALASIRDELPLLADRHRRALAVFHERGVPDIADTEACVLLLADLRTRAAFALAFKEFTETLGVVLPRPEALPYVPDAKRLGLINARARLRYRDEELSLHGAGAQVRQLIDAHLLATGIEPKVRPISILDAGFDAAVAAQGTARSQASEMEHAARHHIAKHYGEDPARYRQLSDRLEELLERFADNWEQLALHLRALIEDARRGRAPDPYGLDPATEAPFRDVLAEEVAPDGALDPAEGARLAEATREIVAHVRGQVGRVDFWRNPEAQNRLRGWIIERLDERDLVPFERQAAAADRLVELAHQRHAWLVG